MTYFNRLSATRGMVGLGKLRTMSAAHLLFFGMASLRQVIHYLLMILLYRPASHHPLLPYILMIDGFQTKHWGECIRPRRSRRSGKQKNIPLAKVRGNWIYQEVRW